MKAFTKWAAVYLALVAPIAGASGLYVDSREVTRSEYYTGEKGVAEIAPLSATDWLGMHEGSAGSLAIRDFGFVVEDRQLDELVYRIANRLLAEWPGTVPRVAIFILAAC